MSRRRSTKVPKLDTVLVKPDIKSEFPTLSPKVPKVRQSGHFVDSKLKYNYPAKNQDQPSLFDRLSPELQGEVAKEEIKYEGIRLTPAEDRLVNALYSLLKEKSETKDADSEKFYKGNYETSELVPFGKEQVKPTHVRIVPAELYRAYLGNDNYSGKEIRDIRKTLDALTDRRFLMIYDRTRTVQVGKRTETRIDRIEMFKRLVAVVKATWDMTPDEAARLSQGDERVRDRKGELIIALNPILTDQINSKWVEYPQDINRRTIIAAGGDHRKVTEAINTLRDLCLSELSKGRNEFERNAERLPWLLKLDNYVKQGRKKLLGEAIEKAVTACKNLGLILDVTTGTGAEGQIKYTFKLNPNFQ